METNESDPPQQSESCEAQFEDEDPHNEAVNDEDVMAKVTLPSTVRKSYLFFLVY
jgi:hypothetical protein